MSTGPDIRLHHLATINNRRWLGTSTPRHDNNDDDDDDDEPRFRLATYNVLSDNTIKPGEYLYCPSQLRYMSSRHERIIAEIRNMQPHIVCFQVFSLSVYKSL